MYSFSEYFADKAFSNYQKQKKSFKHVFFFNHQLIIVAEIVKGSTENSAVNGLS